MKSYAFTSSIEVRSNRYCSRRGAAPAQQHLRALLSDLRRCGKYFLLCAAICFAGLLASAQQANDLANLDLATLQQQAQSGDADAQAELGYRYINGRGVPANYNLAQPWISQSASRGNARGEQMLSWFYKAGLGGLVKNQSQSYHWMQLAAEQSIASAQEGLAGKLKNGDGVCQDLVESAAWTRKAADQGYGVALQDLANDYELGMGVPQDIAEARRWYEKAAIDANPNNASISQSALKRLDAWSATGQRIEHVELPAVGGCALSIDTLAERGNAGDADAKAQAALALQQGDLPTRRRAALGDQNAQQLIGEIYLGNKNYAQAEFWLKRVSQYWGTGNSRADLDLVQIAVIEYRPNESIPPEEMAAMFHPSGSAELPESDFRVMPAVQVLKMLENAGRITLDLKGTNFPGLDRHDEEMGKACNGKKSKASDPGEDACFLVFTNYAQKALNDLTNQANLNYLMSALLRGCGLYAPSDDKAFRGRTCGLLGRTLYAIGNEEAARAVWELAPGCYSQDERSGTPLNGCIRALTGMDGQFFRDTTLNSYHGAVDAYRGEPHRLAEMMWKSCTSIHDRESCEFLQSNAATVDMAAVEQMENERHEGIEEFREQRRAEDERAQADAEARRNAIFGALASMGGANPTSVLDAGNRQAVAIRAIGDANAAHTQSIPQSPVYNNSTQTTTVSNSTGSNVNSPNSTGNNSGNPASSESSSATHETCPNTAYLDFGASCNSVSSMMQCVKVVSSSWNSGAQNYGLLTVVFANTCTQPVRLITKGGEQSNTDGELSNVGAGQQYTFSDSQHNNLYFYSADDGTDCSVNNSRPGCGSNQLLQTK